MFRLIITASLSLLCTSLVFAEWQKPAFTLINTYRDDSKFEDYYIEKISSDFSYKFGDSETYVRVVPFYEERLLVDSSSAIRRSSGFEIGAYLIPWLYLGESFCYVWLEDFSYDWAVDGQVWDGPESLSRIIVNHHLVDLFGVDLRWFIFEEVTCNLDEMEATLNEAGAGIIIPIIESLDLKVNWCHMDRIHHSDSDALEVTVDLTF